MLSGLYPSANIFATITALARVESQIKAVTPPGQPWSLCDDTILRFSRYPPQNSRRHTEGPVEDGVPILRGFSPSPFGEKQHQPFASPFRKLPSTIDQGMACSEIRLGSWVQRIRRIRHRLRVRIREEINQEEAMKIFRQIKSVIADLQTTRFSADAEDGPLVWLMKSEMLIERIYERLRFLYYRLAVYTTACLWPYSEFPGCIRPPCTTMPWTIWPALIVLWGVCWMFYPSPGRATGVAELESQSHLDYQSLPAERGGELLFSGLDAVQLISHSLEVSPFSDEWWALHQSSTIYDPLKLATDHGMAAYPSDSTRQLGPITTAGPAQSPTNSAYLGSVSQPTISPGFQQQSQIQGGWTVAEGITDNIVTTASGSKPTNRFQCPLCYKVLSRRDALERHQRSQHNRGVEEHLCPHKPCKHSRKGSGFARRDGLRRHLKACKSQSRRALTVDLGAVDSQPDSGNETREDSQASNSRQDTCSTQGPNDASSQQSPTNSWVAELRKRYKEAKEVCERKKREVEEAQRVMASYETLIENAEKERAV
ncbi:hypothetical protein LCI18_002218 [Fusarium solani-melongenae]|uniref:Uncharacterized protein n=1 Tax=Fusarium solani subsp. cucurbitae TaxID=2747967 RepID=A0ACD3YQQ4_FUSSC|nr:hypothetical protein LCI18_002218 [Fusarium solani-melongenae]